MTERVVAWSARHHRIVVVLALILALAGELCRRALHRDVLPDISDPQIVLVADWPSRPASEVARSVTTVLAKALEGVPDSKAVRGASMAGMAYIDVVFHSSAGLEEGRRAIRERVAASASRLPGDVRVRVGPAASSTAWVYQYALLDPTGARPPQALRDIQDTVLRPALERVDGVAEIASVGGAAPQIVVELRGDQLREHGLAFSNALPALKTALANQRALDVPQIEALPLNTQPSSTAPILVRDVARVRITHDMPSGIADYGGQMPAVGGIVIAKGGAALAPMIEGVRRTLDRERARLPVGTRLVTVYDRLELTDGVERTLLRALCEEIAVVVLVILVFLLHARSALLPLLTLPLVLACTFAGMWLLGVSATVMSLGGIAIALGMAVDADVVALEACHRRIEEAGGAVATRRADLLAAAASFAPPILTSLLIGALSFLPVFAFSGETGRLLHPLAITKTLVILAAALLTLTLAPALRDRLLVASVKPEFDNPLTRRLVAIYRPFVHFALTRPLFTSFTAVLALLSCLPLLPRLGGEFMPRIDEGDLLFMPTTLPGAPMMEAGDQLRRQDRAISEFREVSTVFGKIGRADSATDPAPMSMVETTIRLRPRSEWPKRARSRWYSAWAPESLRPMLGAVWPEESPATTAELIEDMDRATRLPGWTNAWTAPIRARMDMMTTGVRTPVGIRIIAADPARLDALGSALRKLMLRVPGTRSAVFEAQGGQTVLEFETDPSALASLGVDSALVQATSDLVLSGGQIGETERAGRRLRVRVSPDLSLAAADRLREVTVPAGTGEIVPLALLGNPIFKNRPSLLRNEQGISVGYVYVDLKSLGDVLGFVERAKSEIERALSAREFELATTERFEWTGQYELFAKGRRMLLWIVPMVLLTMLGLLYLQFQSMTEALIIMASVPFALVGSIWTLFLLGYPLSAPVWVGLLSTVGLAMQTGVVMVVYIDHVFHRRVREGRITSRTDIVEAHAEGTVRRLRPKIMTISTMAAGLLPLLWGEGPGAEIMKRVAAPMLGGLLTSAFLTLEVLPVLYTIWRNRQLERAKRSGVPLATVVGRVPSWAER